MKKAVTINDIAEELGLSRNTVSKALNGQHVPQKTRELIFKKAREMNYKSINDTFSNKNYRILLFSGKPIHNMDFFIPIIKTIEDDCYRQNFDIFQYTYNPIIASFSKLNEYIRKLNVDGIIAVESFDIPLVKNILSLDIPVCFLDFPGRYFVNDKKFDLINSSNQESLCNFVKQLIHDKGFKDFAFVGDFRHCLSFHERYMGMLRGIDRSGLTHSPQSDILIDDDKFDYGDVSLLKEKIREYNRLPDCFVCCNDFVARRMTIALKELGYDVPTDTTIIGYDGTNESTKQSPIITTFYLDKEFLGHEAMRLLISRIENHNCPIRDIIVQSELIIGESTR